MKRNLKIKTLLSALFLFAFILFTSSCENNQQYQQDLSEIKKDTINTSIPQNGTYGIDENGKLMTQKELDEKVNSDLKKIGIVAAVAAVLYFIFSDDDEKPVQNQNNGNQNTYWDDQNYVRDIQREERYENERRQENIRKEEEMKEIENERNNNY